MALRIKAVIACDKNLCKVQQEFEIEVSASEIDKRLLLTVTHKLDALPEGWSFHSTYGDTEVRCPEHTDPFW